MSNVNPNRMKKYLLIASFPLVLLGNTVLAQGILNKIKSKANQEVNKLERGVTSPSSSGAPNQNKISSNVTRTVVVSLSSDEVFDYSENCIDLGASVNQTSFIVTKGSGNTAKCFSYKNGIKTPVPCPNSTNCSASPQCSYYKLREISLDSDEAKKYITNQTESHSLTQPTLSDEQMKAMAAYMTKEQMDAMKKQLEEAKKQTANQSYSTIASSTINFNGKNYGPYKSLTQFSLTPDGKNFYAVIKEDNQSPAKFGYKVITSASSATITAPGMMPPMACIAAPDNSEFAIYVASNQGKYVIQTSTGKSTDVANAGWFGGAWYSATGNHIIMLSKNQLYYDGQVVKTFPENVSIQPCDLYVSSDGKGVTTIKDNIISFADGDYFQYPLRVAIVNEGGKTFFKWIALENREVIIYQKPY